MLACKRYYLIFFSCISISCTRLAIIPDSIDSNYWVFSKRCLSDTSLVFPKKGKVTVKDAGRSLFEAHTKKGKLNGNWQSWFGDGNLCDSGRFENNLPTGIWKFWNMQGQLLHVREYNADKYVRIKADFSRYNPKTTSYYLSVLYSINKKQALQYLHSSYSFPNYSYQEKNKTIQAVVAANILVVTQYQPVFANCLHDGLYINYATSGIAVDSGYYKDGLKAGHWIHRNLSENKI